MKHKFLSLTTIIMVGALFLAACALPVNSSNEQGNVEETMVALALTQTTIADNPEVTENEEASTVPEATPTPMPEPTQIAHIMFPGEPGFISNWFYDTNSGNSASTGSITGGDDFIANLFERPFTEGEMDYRPDIDIIRTEISNDSNFIYVNIILNGEHPEGGLPASYGVEIDWDRDGRGELLIIAENPNPIEWNIAGVSVHRDSNSDVGGSSIQRPDSNYSGDGYEEILFSQDDLDDPDAAWARWVAGDNPVVTLAFKKSLLSGDNTFVWGVWAAETLLTPENLDLHDRFTQNEAGSPYPSRSDYPLAAVNLVDNTCRKTFGFEATTPILGLCFVPTAEEEPTPSTPGSHDDLPGSLIGSAFDDLDNDGIRDPGEPDTVYNVTITVHDDSCTNPALDSTTEKFFNFSGLGPGMICVKITGGGPMTTPNQYIVEIVPGGSAYVDFGFETPE